MFDSFYVALIFFSYFVMMFADIPLFTMPERCMGLLNVISDISGRGLNGREGGDNKISQILVGLDTGWPLAWKTWKTWKSQEI